MTMTEHSRESTSSEDETERVVHAPGSGEDATHGTNRMLERRPPTTSSSSGLASRDYRPRTGGPELVASWPLGPAPGQTEPGDDPWILEDRSFTLLKRTLLQLPYLGPIDYNKIYLNVRGRGHVESSAETVTLRLSNENLSGKPYETEISLSNDESEPFILPMVDASPDGREYGSHDFIGKEMYGGVSLEGKVSGGRAFLDQGTAIQLWSE